MRIKTAKENTERTRDNLLVLTQCFVYFYAWHAQLVARKTAEVSVLHDKMSEFVEIYWRSPSSSSPLSSLSSLSLSSSSLLSSTSATGAAEFVVIYLSRRHDEVSAQEQDAVESDEIYSRLRPNADEFAVFDQLPRSTYINQLNSHYYDNIHISVN